MASLLSYALTNVADVKEQLGIESSDSTYNNLIIRKINQATEIIEGWCSRRFAVTTYTDELYDASHTGQLQLRQFPLTTSTITLKARDTTINTGSFDTIDTDQYFVDANTGIIDAISSFWGSFDQWSVTYTAGYVTIPSDLAEACCTLASYFMANDPATSMSISSKHEGQRSISYFSGSNEKLFERLGIRFTLDRYAKIIIAPNP